MILGGDIGGTNSRLSVFALEGGRLVRRWSRVYPSGEHAGLVPILRLAREEIGAVEAASVGVAGPVRDGRVQATNLPWEVAASELAEALGLERVDLLNDLEAYAWGLLALPPESTVALNDGDPTVRGNIALLAAGTGLGQAGLYFDGARHHPFASEGGHASFAPATELHVELWRWLKERHGAVSWERVLSGPGLEAIYAFLREGGRHGAEAAWLAERMSAGGDAAAISRAAMEEGDPLASHALDTFVSLYGSAAGNLALQLLATGGLYLGGGIAPKILPWLQRPEFRDAFLDKGRMRPLLERVPVRVVLDDHAAQRGAALHAALGAGLVDPAAVDMVRLPSR